MTTNTEINYYIFDVIERDEDGCLRGYIDDKWCEVFDLSPDDTEDKLIENGFAKCDAPGTETFVVSEGDIVIVNNKVKIL